MRFFVLVILIFLFSGIAHSQEKEPEINNDYLSITAGDTVTINALVNDWGMEGHSIVIFNVYHGTGGYASFEDSCITYESQFYFSGVDSVRYVLLDEDNGLFSEPGYVVITVANEGRANLDINNIDAFVQSFGLQFCDMSGGVHKPSFEVPRGTNRKAIFVYNLWLGGLDANNEIHLAAERYRSNGADLWNGPVSSTYENQQILDYNKVWQLNREDIEYHRQHWWETEYEPSANIAGWPAHGNVDLGQSENLAAYNDRNEDGEYQWDNGDYPAIRGDRGIFFLYNDDFTDHTASGGANLKAEVHGQAYAYDCPDDSTFFNTVFFHYDIISRSELDYHDFYIGAYIDFDLGDPWDDYIGCDTLLNAVYAYNGDDYDASDSMPGYPTNWGYHDRPPAQAMVYLNVPMNSAIGFSNYGGISGDPYGDVEIYNTMQGLWKYGDPITVGGDGTGGSVATRYLYSGNPSTPGDWTEYNEGNNPSDRRTITAAGPFNFNGNDTLRLDVAFVFARDYEGDQISSVDLLKERIQQLQWYYDNDSTPCGKAWTGNTKNYSEDSKLLVYPNPSSGWITVETGDVNAEYLISDLAGRVVLQGIFTQAKNNLDISELNKGIYFLSLQGEGRSESCKLIIK